MPVSKRPSKKHNAKVSTQLFLRAIGGKKLVARMIQGQKEWDEADKEAIFNFGLPPIADLDGPAEC